MKERTKAPDRFSSSPQLLSCGASLRHPFREGVLFRQCAAFDHARSCWRSHYGRQGEMSFGHPRALVPCRDFHAGASSNVCFIQDRMVNLACFAMLIVLTPQDRQGNCSPILCYLWRLSCFSRFFTNIMYIYSPSGERFSSITLSE